MSDKELLNRCDPKEGEVKEMVLINRRNGVNGIPKEPTGKSSYDRGGGTVRDKLHIWIQ